MKTLRLFSLMVNVLVSIGTSLLVWNCVGMPLVMKMQENQVVRYVTVTAYSARVQETDSTPTITAFMTTVKPGRTIAVSRDMLLAGWTPHRWVYIVGLGMFRIDDIMKKDLRSTIDLLMHTRKDAIDFGNRNMVAILITGTAG